MLHPMAEPRMTMRQAVWSRHWSTGATHSCAGSYGKLYGGAIADFWRRVHADTPADARVLDVASGSGAVPRLLRHLRPDLDCQYEAVDLAFAPPAELPWLKFHAGVAAEALPFDDGSFALVTSQYGVEYGDLDRALPELLRVRRTHGRIALVLHHAGSLPVRLARVELDHLDWLEGPDGLLAASEAMLPMLLQARTQEGRSRLAIEPAAEAIRLRFNAAQDALTARARTQPDGADVLGETQDAVASMLGAALQSGADPAWAARSELRQRLSDGRWRLRELCDCALDEAAARALASRLRQAGLRAEPMLLTEGSHLMGWALYATPA
jgi:SAM-dependent methyltransferase